MRSTGTRLAGYAGKTCQQAPSRKPMGRPARPKKLKLPTQLRTALPLHLAPQRATIQQAPLQHTVEKADIVKGYEYEKGKYAIVEPAELKNFRLAGKKTIELSQFSPAGEIDPALYEKPYFVMPKAGPQAFAFSVVRQSMAESGMVGVGEIVFSGRQHLMTLAPSHDPNQPGMMLYTLRFASELRNARDYSTETESQQADAAQLGLAKQLIPAYTQPFEASKFKDHYEERYGSWSKPRSKIFPCPSQRSKGSRQRSWI